MAEHVAITVNSVSKTFKLPHEKNTSIKNAVVNFYRRKRTFEKQQVLKDVSFEVKQGEFFGIVGRNGSGKSTLLKLLAGIYSPTEGSITVNGKLTPFIELGVGFNPELTGRENVFLNGALLGFNRKEMDAMYDDIVEFSEIERFMDQKLKNYSSGMQVRLAFSIAIRANGDILLLDEVLAVGDAAFQQKCFNYFEELKRAGKTVVFVSHDMNSVRRFCSRAMFIDEGVLKHIGTPSEISDIYTTENIADPAVREKALKGISAKGDQLRPAIKVRTEGPVNGKLTIIVEIKDAPKAKHYIGFSLMKDGLSVGELNTHEAPRTAQHETYRYALDTGGLNGGLYEVGAALFEWKNREILAFTALGEKAKFQVMGSDLSRGAALKLPDTWLS